MTNSMSNPIIISIDGNIGSGKSTLINHTLYPITATVLNKATTLKPRPYEAIDGLQHL